jgi:hypothetical protein
MLAERNDGKRAIRVHRKICNHSELLSTNTQSNRTLPPFSGLDSHFINSCYAEKSSVQFLVYFLGTRASVVSNPSILFNLLTSSLKISGRTLALFNTRLRRVAIFLQMTAGNKELRRPYSLKYDETLSSDGMCFCPTGTAHVDSLSTRQPLFREAI